MNEGFSGQEQKSKSRMIFLLIGIIVVILILFFFVFGKSTKIDTSSEKVQNPMQICSSEGGFKDICFKGLAIYNEDKILCSNINDETKKEECLNILNSGTFMFREYVILEVADANACSNNPSEFNQKCKNRCEQNSLNYIDYYSETNTPSVGGYFVCDVNEKIIAKTWIACYCY